MTLTRYLLKQVLLAKIAILLVLLLIFFSQKLIQLLSLVATGSVNPRAIAIAVGMAVPYILQVILPLSLFLAILLTYRRLSSRNEIVAMQVCGLGQLGLLMTVLLAASATTLLAAGNLMWAGPKLYQCGLRAMQESQANFGFALASKGEFNSFAGGKWVFFIGDAQKNNFTDLFLAHGTPTRADFTIMVAREGSVCKNQHEDELLLLKDGASYRWQGEPKKFQTMNFENYQAVIGHSVPSQARPVLEAQDLCSLLSSKDPKAFLELHWRLASLISIPLLAMLALPLSLVHKREERGASLFLALILYLIYFLLQGLIHSNINKDNLVSPLGFWLVNLGYLILALFFNYRVLFPSLRVRNLLPKR